MAFPPTQVNSSGDLSRELIKRVKKNLLMLFIRAPSILTTDLEQLLRD